MKLNECYVYFAFDGEDFEPEEITRILNVTPTSIKRKGERTLSRILKHNSWRLSTPKIVSEYIDVCEMASSIIRILEPKTDVIKDIKNKFGVTVRLEVVLWITVHEEISTPAIGFEAKDIKFLADVGAYIDVDTYRN